MAWKPLPATVEIELETPKPREFTLDPKTAAVIVVDMQNVSKKNPNGRAVDAIEGNARLLAKAREAGAKVVYIKSIRHVESPEHTTFRRPVHRIVGTWDVEIMDEIAPLPGETVIEKWSHDVFAWYGLLEDWLEKEGVVAGESTVVVTGVSAAQCAQAASLGFSNRHYHTLVAMDCQAANIESEARTYAQYQHPGYSYNMDFTLSTMVNFAPKQELEVPIEIPVGS